MRERKTPRRIPEGKPNYFVFEVPDKGEHHFRLPFPVWAARLTELLRSSGIAKLSDTDAAVRHLDTATEVWLCGGAAIGLCWHHRTLDLETDRRDFDGDLRAYGEAVLEELWEEGYGVEHLRGLYPELVGRLTRSLVSREEVQKRAGFFGQTEGSTSSLPSTSDSTS